MKSKIYSSTIFVGVWSLSPDLKIKEITHYLYFVCVLFYTWFFPSKMDSI